MNQNTIEPRINGILAYGSILFDPKEKINKAKTATSDTVTPFSVEFARVSGDSRGFAPTLVPFMA